MSIWTNDPDHGVGNIVLMLINLILLLKLFFQILFFCFLPCSTTTFPCVNFSKLRLLHTHNWLGRYIQLLRKNMEISTVDITKAFTFRIRECTTWPSNVPCALTQFPNSLSENFLGHFPCFPCAVGTMSNVDFRKWTYRPVKFKSHGPISSPQVMVINPTSPDQPTSSNPSLPQWPRDLTNRPATSSHAARDPPSSPRDATTCPASCLPRMRTNTTIQPAHSPPFNTNPKGTTLRKGLHSNCPRGLIWLGLTPRALSGCRWSLLILQTCILLADFHNSVNWHLGREKNVLLHMN